MLLLDSADSTTQWFAIFSATLNTLQTIALAYIAARWRPNGR